MSIAIQVTGPDGHAIGMEFTPATARRMVTSLLMQLAAESGEAEDPGVVFPCGCVIGRQENGAAEVRHVCPEVGMGLVSDVEAPDAEERGRLLIAALVEHGVLSA